MTFYASLFGVLMLFPISLCENSLGQIRHFSLTSLLSVIYMGVGASGIGYLLFNVSIKKLGPTRTSSLVYSFVPIFVAILAPALLWRTDHHGHARQRRPDYLRPAPYAGLTGSSKKILQKHDPTANMQCCE